MKPTVIVIGAGIVGAAAAEALGSAGLRCIVVERSVPASGATGHSGGLVRCYEADAARSALAAQGARALRALDRRTNGGCGYVQAGSLYLEAEGREEEAARLARDISTREWPVRILDARTAADRYPHLRWDDVGLAVEEPEAGFADPVRTVQTLLDLARGHGINVLKRCPARRVIERRGRVTGVEIDGRVLDADAVVVAAGGWSPELLRPFEPTSELRTKRIQYVLARYHRSVALPALIDAVDDLYCRPDKEKQVLLGAGIDDWDTPPGRLAPKALVSERIVRAVRRRIKGIDAGAVIGAVAASDLYTPEGLGRLGFSPLLDGLYIATGWSGGGFKMGLGIGRKIAQDLATWFDD